MDHTHFLQKFLTALQNIPNSENRDDITARSLLAVIDMIHALPNDVVPNHVYQSILGTMLALDDQQKQRGEVNDEALSRQGKNIPTNLDQIAAGLLHSAAGYLYTKEKLTQKKAAERIAELMRRLGAKRDIASVARLHNKLRTNQAHIIYPHQIIERESEFEAAIAAYMKCSDST